MCSRALKQYDDPNAWHNQIYELVTSNIDEGKFKPLFKAGNMGRGNASIRQLVGIMIMKEGNRRSDEQMFEAVEFNLLVRKALGLVNLSDQAPSFDTYYLLRRRMVAYEEETGINLLDCCFKDVTKGDQKVKGYSVNATENNDEQGGLSLITDVEVRPATAADKDFLQPGVEGSMEVTGNMPEHINADGAYQSDGNHDFAADNLIDFVTSGLQGKPSRYDLTLKDGQLTVVDKSSGKDVPITRTGGKWRIEAKGKAKYRYFTQEQAEKAMLRKKLEAIPKTELDRRNNVEAAMFQISYHTRNGKTRYRGLVKHVMWACSRCMWMNFIRLMIFQTKTSQRTLFGLFGPVFGCMRSRLTHARGFLHAPRYVVSGWQMVSFRMQFAFTA